MAKTEDLFKKVIAHAKEYGFIFPSSEIYDGLSAVYDYGQNGVELKKNIREYWWKAMVQMNENIVGIDAAIFMHPTTWKASGHVDAFNDPLIDNKDSKKRYRADVLVEDYVAKLENEAEKEFVKLKKKIDSKFEDFSQCRACFTHLMNEFLKSKESEGISFQPDYETFKVFYLNFSTDEGEKLNQHERIFRKLLKGDLILKRLGKSLENEDLADVKALIEELEIADPETGSRNWTDVKQFNLMFGTKIGASADATMDL